jgi:hypothetical protein
MVQVGNVSLAMPIYHRYYYCVEVVEYRVDNLVNDADHAEVGEVFDVMMLDVVVAPMVDVHHLMMVRLLTLSLLWWWMWHELLRMVSPLLWLPDDASLPVLERELKTQPKQKVSQANGMDVKCV